MSEDQQTYQRAVAGAGLGLVVQLLAGGGLLLAAFFADNAALFAATWYAFGGLLLWISLWVVYQQHKLERAEALETEQLADTRGTDSSIFETSAEDLLVARTRLRRLYRIGLPLTSLITAAYLVGVGLWLMLGSLDQLAAAAALHPRAQDWLLGLAFIFALGAFLLFIVSRYLAGMAKVPQWGLLRGGAGYLMGIVLVALAFLVAWLVQYYAQSNWLLGYLAVGVPGLMIVVGGEMALNLLLDLYRPRRPGEVARPAFDSRLLGLLTTPESIARTINEAINYQFGFEITRSWFWQLLTRAFGALVLVAAVALLVISCVVIVPEGRQAIVLRFGQLVTDTEPLDPGFHLKMPWPISSAIQYDVTTIRTLKAGDEASLAEDVPILWTNQHLVTDPVNLIAAQPQFVQSGDGERELPTEQAEADAETEDGERRIPSVSLVNAEIDVQYRIKPGGLLDYVRSVSDARRGSDDPRDVDGPERLLKAIAQLEVARWMFANDIDSLIGRARITGSELLQQRIQAEADRAKLGLEVMDVAIKAIHPPATPAEAFHESVSAVQEAQQAIEQARRDAIQALAEVAGSTNRAQLIIQRIETLEQAKRQGATPEQVVEMEQDLEEMLRRAGGTAAATIAQARADRWQRENEARGRAELYRSELLAVRQSPQYYRVRAYLDVLKEGLVDARKYMIIADHGRLITRFDFKDLRGGFEAVDLTEEE